MEPLCDSRIQGRDAVAHGRGHHKQLVGYAEGRPVGQGAGEAADGAHVVQLGQAGRQFFRAGHTRRSVVAGRIDGHYVERLQLSGAQVLGQDLEAHAGLVLVGEVAQ